MCKDKKSILVLSRSELGRTFAIVLFNYHGKLINIVVIEVEGVCKRPGLVWSDGQMENEKEGERLCSGNDSGFGK